MANVMFKKGLFDALPTTNATEGTFYLTTDTNQLFVGKSDKSLARIGGDLIVVNSLPAVGQIGAFYYLPNSNILAYYNEGKWTQTNPDTYYDTFVDDGATGFTTETVYVKDGKEVESTVEGAKHVIKVTYSLHQKVVNREGQVVNAEDTDHYSTENPLANPIEKSFYITQDDFNAIIDGAEVGLIVDVINKVATIKTSGTGSDDKTNINIKGEEITIKKDEDGNLVFTGHNYDLNNLNDKEGPKAAINFYEDGTEIGTVAFTANVTGGKNEDLVISAKEGEINYAHKDYTYADPSGKNAPTIGDTTAGSTIKVVTGATVTNGHITGLTTSELTLPEDANDQFSISGVEANSNGDIVVKMAKNGTYDETISGKAEQAIYFKDGDDTVIYNQGDLGISKKIEDALKPLKSLDALVYRGTVSASDGKFVLPTEGVQIGDTYKTATVGTYEDIAVSIGDLFIATGTEGNDGYISSGLTWTYIASGSDTDTTYGFKLENNIYTVEASTEETYKVKYHNGKTDTEGNDDIVITTKDGTSDNVDKILEIAHKEYATHAVPTVTTGTTTAGQKINVVTNVITSNGHVTAVDTGELTLPEDKDSIYNLSVEDGKAEIHLIGSGTADKQDDAITMAVGKGNDSLSVDSDENTIIYSHKTYTYTAPSGKDVPTTGSTTAGSTIKVVTGATVANGHITGLTTSELTLPEDKDSVYALTGATITSATTTIQNVEYKGVTITDTLTGSGSAAGQVDTSAVSVTSASLNIVANGTIEDKPNYSIDLVWGTFN